MSHTTDAHALLERLDSDRPTNTEIRPIAQEQGKNSLHHDIDLSRS